MLRIYYIQIILQNTSHYVQMPPDRLRCQMEYVGQLVLYPPPPFDAPYCLTFLNILTLFYGMVHAKIDIFES